MSSSKIISKIKRTVELQAVNRKKDAAWSGQHDDGGASESLLKLEAWLDGIAFAQTGKTEVYGELVNQIEIEEDPEYIEYLRLQKKFKK
jgi:hypothetical protein